MGHVWDPQNPTVLQGTQSGLDPAWIRFGSGLDPVWIRLDPVCCGLIRFDPVGAGSWPEQALAKPGRTPPSRAHPQDDVS